MGLALFRVIDETAAWLTVSEAPEAELAVYTGSAARVGGVGPPGPKKACTL